MPKPNYLTADLQLDLPAIEAEIISRIARGWSRAVATDHVMSDAQSAREWELAVSDLLESFKGDADALYREWDSRSFGMIDAAGAGVAKEAWKRAFDAAKAERVAA